MTPEQLAEIRAVVDQAKAASPCALVALPHAQIAALLDEVERLTVERDRLTEALRPFSRLSGLFAHWQDDTKMRLSVTVGDVRRACAALTPNT